VVARQVYEAWGEARWSAGTLPTDFTFTGQRDVGLGLLFVHARYYHVGLGRWTAADTIVPQPGNPQSLNRYSYCGNSPVKYADPDGRSAWPFVIVLGLAYVGGRVTYEAASLVFRESERRDQIGGQLVTDASEIIQRESALHSVDPALVGAVLRHESAAVERRLLTLWPTMQPGVIANAFEYMQSALPEGSIGPMRFGDGASIGPGQMQLGLARDLESWGYVTPRANDAERRSALLGNETSVGYVAGYLQYLSDQLSTLSGFSELDTEAQNRLILLGYNRGWAGLRGLIERYGFAEAIEQVKYDKGASLEL
jgi:RHS repeat-associated protein